ncbi:MAG: protein kinase, partial [Chloroflexota bacterium]
AYMSPEQGQGERGDERSDIYSLGVMLYEMVTGTVPYDADTPFAVIMQHISQPLPLPTKINPDIPEPVERVILKALSKNPDDRFQTAGELARDLREAVGIGAHDTLISAPLKTVAPPPKIQQIEHATGPLTRQERAATAAAEQEATTVSKGDTLAAKTVPVLPVAIGGLVMLGLIVAGLVGAVVWLRPTPTPTATQDFSAIAAITQTAQAGITAIAQANVDATATAESAAALAPTKTAQAALDIASTATTQFEQQASLIQGFIATSQAATAEVVTAQAAAAETATAETLANVTPTPPATDTPLPPDTPTVGPPPVTPTPAPPTSTPAPEKPALSGKLAFPVDNGFAVYNVYIVSIPEGEQLAKIDGARQPDFQRNGSKLLINGQSSGFGENVFEANAGGGVEKPVSGSPTDSHPIYNPDGNRLAYDNPQLAIGSDGNYHSYIFVQCGLIPPSQEGDQSCNDIARFGILVPAGQIGEIQGSNPVWTDSDQIIYKGCNSWAGGQSCGLFIVGSWGNKRSGNGETPRKIADGTSLIPTDTRGNWVAFHSRESGDWEAYVMDLNGAGMVNLSNSPTSNDGLPTLSPDGQWVAFASDREGSWAVYAVSMSGGPPTKLFDFPKSNPWGAGGDREWTNERMSWGQ